MSKYLTDEEITVVTGETFRFVSSDERAIANAAADHALKDLAEKCGPKPCEGCVERVSFRCDDKDGFSQSYNVACGPYAKWLGQQEGLAEAESKVSAMAREIVGLLHDKAESRSLYSLQFENASIERTLNRQTALGIEEAAVIIQEYLKEKGVLNG